MQWKVNILGQRNSKSWEISVVRENNKHGQRSYGWFDSSKFLVSHNGGPCSWGICGFVFDAQVRIAIELCRRLNAGESIDC